MKLLCGVLILVCLLQTYLLMQAQQTQKVLQSSSTSLRNNYINRDIIDIQIDIKLANEMVTNPSNGLAIINNVICKGNPFPDNYLHAASIPEDMLERMKSIKQDVIAYCKSQSDNNQINASQLSSSQLSSSQSSSAQSISSQ